MAEATVKSPCISVCVLDKNDICEGCYRSAEEITDWHSMADEERLLVLQKVQQRFQQGGKNTLL